MSAESTDCFAIEMQLLHRKTVAEAFWNGELEDEIRKKDMVEWRFQDCRSREKCMQEIDNIRAVTPYKHSICSEECNERGKDKCLIYN